MIKNTLEERLHEAMAFHEIPTPYILNVENIPKLRKDLQKAALAVFMNYLKEAGNDLKANTKTLRQLAGYVGCCENENSALPCDEICDKQYVPVEEVSKIFAENKLLKEQMETAKQILQKLLANAKPLNYYTKNPDICYTMRQDYKWLSEYHLSELKTSLKLDEALKK